MVVRAITYILQSSVDKLHIAVYFKSNSDIYFNSWKYKEQIDNLIDNQFSVITLIVTLSFCLKTNILLIVSYR